MENEIIKWLQAMAPWVGIVVTIFVAFRVQGVHNLVNSEMDKFRATLQRLADADSDRVFHAGQQDIRDKNKLVTTEAARATTEAAGATTAAAGATTAAAGATTAAAEAITATASSPAS